MTLIDTNVLLDLLLDDPVWGIWSRNQLDAAALRGPMLINGVVYSELSVRFDRIEALDTTLVAMGVELIEPPREAYFLAGKAYQAYRSAGGPRTGVLPDFFIGAHGAAANLALLTRDPRRYRTYFPRLSLIAP